MPHDFIYYPHKGHLASQSALTFQLVRAIKLVFRDKIVNCVSSPPWSFNAQTGVMPIKLVTTQTDWWTQHPGTTGVGWQSRSPAQVTKDNGNDSSCTKSTHGEALFGANSNPTKISTPFLPSHRMHLIRLFNIPAISNFPSFDHLNYPLGDYLRFRKLWLGSLYPARPKELTTADWCTIQIKCNKKGKHLKRFRNS